MKTLFKMIYHVHQVVLGRLWRCVVDYSIGGISLFVIGLLVKFKRKDRGNVIYWGPVPLVNNKYWANALKADYESVTFMYSFYDKINKKDDFDLYPQEVIPGWLQRIPFLSQRLADYICFMHVLTSANVVVMSFMGGYLSRTRFKYLEIFFYKWLGIKTVVIVFGGDAWLYDQINDPTVTNTLLQAYPGFVFQQREVHKQVEHFSHHADIVCPCTMMDGIGRWDLPLFSIVSIDTALWSPKDEYSSFDGHNGEVLIAHAPNNRKTKGTIYLQQAIKELQNEGLKIKLLLLENITNEDVRKSIREADVLAEQFILPGYGINGVEGMASGMPVMSNLDNEFYTRIFRRESFLDECPILSTTPETLKSHLRLLVENPELRREMGLASRRYVEKYHSEQTARYVFGSIFNKVLGKEEVDLFGLFHPITSEYNRRTPKIDVDFSRYRRTAQQQIEEHRVPSGYRSTEAMSYSTIIHGDITEG